jgi:hypothetical protein
MNQEDCGKEFIVTKFELLSRDLTGDAVETTGPLRITGLRAKI